MVLPTDSILRRLKRNLIAIIELKRVRLGLELWQGLEIERSNCLMGYGSFMLYGEPDLIQRSIDYFTCNSLYEVHRR